MKKNLLYPFALTTLVMALTACGGESANVIPEPEEATTNGSCNPTASNCLEWGLEYPLDGLNFNCSGDKENKFITLFNVRDGVASGSCRKTDHVEFYIESHGGRKIELGSIKLGEFLSLSTTSQLPRLGVLDIAKGITGRSVYELKPSDATVQVAMKLVKIWQTMALDQGNIYNPTDVQPLYIEDSRKALDQLSKNIKLTDTDFVEILKPALDISKISDEQAFKVVEKLANIANAAVYQPEFSLFSTSGIIGNQFSGSDGLTGCNKPSCDIKDKTNKYLFGHFMLITDRQGYTFGSGLQWRDSQLKLADSNLSSLGGINAELIRKVKPQQMTANPQTSWIHPATKTISNYKMNIGHKEANNESQLEVYQGRLLSDYVMAGKENFYKLITGKTSLDDNDRASLGLWRMNADSEDYRGSVDLYKIYPISYLDRQVFKTVENVRPGESYIFPMYGNLEFKFTESSVDPVTVGIVIDSNGNVRTNRQSATQLSTDPVNGCTGDVLANNLLDERGVQQYRLGTLGRAFTQDKTVSMRLIFADPVFASLNGALIGLNSSIQGSSNSADLIVVGGALLNLNHVLSTPVGQTGRVSFANSAGENVGWANTYASFQKIYNNNNTDESPADIEVAKYSGGEVSFRLAECYQVKAKTNG